MIKITRRSQFPACVRGISQLKGICVGGCVDKKQNDLGPNRVAHAHTNAFHKYGGWICVQYKYVLKQKLILLHEAAHLIVGVTAVPHGKIWKDTVVKIGGTFRSFRYTSSPGVVWENVDYTYRNTMR